MLAVDKKSKPESEKELFTFDKTGDISVRYLRESYNAAKSRASELSTSTGLTINVKAHCQQSVRIYSALATLLYATISISKADDLERFVKKRAFQVPNALFDLEEWSPVLQVARTVRLGESARHFDELNDFKRSMRYQLQKLLSTMKALTVQSKMIKSEASTQISMLKKEIEALKENIIPLIRNKLRDMKRENESLRLSLLEKDRGLAKMTETHLSSNKEHSERIEQLQSDHRKALEAMQTKHEEALAEKDATHAQELEAQQLTFNKREKEFEEKHSEDISKMQAEIGALRSSNGEALAEAHNSMEKIKTHYEMEIARLQEVFDESSAEAQKQLDSTTIRLNCLVENTKRSYEDRIATMEGDHAATCSKLKGDIERLEGLMSDMEKDLQKKAAEYNDLESSRNIISEEKETLQGELESTISQVEELQKKIELQGSTLSSQSKQLETELTEKKRQLEMTTKDLNDLRSQYEDVSNAKKSMEDSHASTVTELQEKLSRSETTITNQQEQIKKLLKDKRVAENMEYDNSRQREEEKAKLLSQLLQSEQTVAALKQQMKVNEKEKKAQAQLVYNESRQREEEKAALLSKLLRAEGALASKEKVSSIGQQQNVAENAEISRLRAEVERLTTEKAALKHVDQKCDKCEALKEGVVRNRVLEVAQFISQYTIDDALHRVQTALKRDETLPSVPTVSIPPPDVVVQKVTSIDIDPEVKQFDRPAFVKSTTDAVLSESMKRAINDATRKLQSRLDEREKEIESLRDKIRSQEKEKENQVISLNESLASERSAMQNLRNQITSYENLLASRSVEINDLKAKETEMKSRLSTLEESLQGAEEELRLSRMNSIEARSSTLSPRSLSRVNKLQAAARGFIARASTTRMKIHHAAKTSGVLVAMRKTIQGESGWYCAPNGSLYYFVLDEGEWLLTCGPISKEKFEETVNSSKVSTRKDPVSGAFLKRCDFELVAQAVDFEGEVYISPATWKLYFVISVDTLMIDSK
mmetsp:Transcript_816/g.1370  ORF Transcript_816/g.1370 Transcript_816/m.1370 type:complete len:992 (-) Transcript_816:209-3184(-)|eukprot:CAMPEP_0185038320 /NCGR_PEP_ID=MMETSP1103-20130426/33838_1 /TAXON_ID=36769 /ORGANISM="Paraphysomonas bandaiensis, Strain Caron Lab Isolate" /LENGTH=991 /DNA_ID=CAMNT_0027576697 /DNA_START=18 /DNA_END=2993 /DNA_ORIENTATION=-